MCDEYDDERMRAFWRGFVVPEEIPRAEREDGETEHPVVTPPLGTPEPRQARLRPLTR
ncbi:MAG TPA: hypothetical protein HA326_06270 [Thermoplasmata archaeon]|nr:hypothetical protein [Thermoplasmata archaeon]